jgi:hypothetical protein
MNVGRNEELSNKDTTLFESYGRTQTEIQELLGRLLTIAIIHS